MSISAAGTASAWLPGRCSHHNILLGSLWCLHCIPHMLNKRKDSFKLSYLIFFYYHLIHSGQEIPCLKLPACECQYQSQDSTFTRTLHFWLKKILFTWCSAPTFDRLDPSQMQQPCHQLKLQGWRLCLLWIKKNEKQTIKGTASYHHLLLCLQHYNQLANWTSAPVLSNP